MRHGASRRGLLSVDTFLIAKDVLGQTVDFLRAAGVAGAEGFVIWAGKFNTANAFRFSRAIVPEQLPLTTDHGLLVTVKGEALFAANKLSYEREEILAGQVHTHPTSAYHSATDDHYPLVTLVGALSVVLPNFAKHAPADIHDWAWYRLVAYGRWEPLGQQTKVIFE
jgi:hypothetical protein